jgi:hypothetical protein
MLRKSGIAIAYFLAGLVLLVAMVVVHLPTAAGRRLVRDVANSILKDTFLGELHIGEVTDIELKGRLQARDIWLRDPDGEWIATGGELVGFRVSQLIAGLRARGPMPTVQLHVRRFWLRGLTHAIPAEASAPPMDVGSASIAAAFRLRHPPPRTTVVNPPGRGLLFPRMDLTVDAIRSTLGDVTVDGSAAQASTGALTDPVQFWVGPIARRGDARRLEPLTIASATTERAGPLRITATFDYHAEFVTEPVRRYESNLDALAHLTGDGLDCVLHYQQRHDRVHVETTGCMASSGVVDRAAGAPIGFGVAVSHAAFDVVTTTGAMQLALEAEANGQHVGLDASGDLEHLEARVRAAHVDLSRVRSDLPQSDIDGTMVVGRQGDEWRLDSTDLEGTVAGVDVPGVTARATLHGGRLAIRQFDAPQMGLRAHGDVDLAGANHDLHIDAHLENDDLRTFPGLGEGVRGTARGDVQIDRRNGVLHANVDLTTRNVRAPGLHVDSGAVRGTASMRGDDLEVDADVRANGFSAGATGPLDVNGHVRGDPRTALRGNVHADLSRMAALRGNAPTRVDADFTARVTDHGVHVAVNDAPVTLRGENARVTADVDVPIGRGAPAGRARIVTSSGGEADVSIRGTSVTGRFSHFSMDWLGRAIGTPFPLGGTIEGDLDLLTQRTGATSGQLHWRNGQLPYIGMFDLDVTADHRGGESDIQATLNFGADRAALTADRQHVVRVRVQGRPPRNLADLPGWIRGMREARVDGQHIPLRMLEQNLPRGARVNGDGAFVLVAQRTEPGAPLDTTLGWDVRNTQLGADAADYLPTQLRGLVRQTVTARPLTELARWRGALCGRVLRDDLTLVPITVATTIARETGEPIVPPPAACEAADVASQEPWVQLTGSLRGPWYAATTGLIDDFTTPQRAGTRTSPRTGLARISPQTEQAMREALVQMHVDIGPINTERWPFAPTLETFVPPLARPRIPGVGHATIDVAGSIYSATADADVTVHTSGLEALVARDEIDAHAHLRLAPTTEDGSVWGSVTVRGDADARLMARTPRGLQEAGTANAALRFRDELTRLFDPSQGLRSAEFERIEASTSRLQIGRLRWARSNNVEGLLTLTVRGTGDPITPIAMNATLTDVQVRNQRAMAASVNGFVRNVEGEWEVQGCTTMLESSTAPAICDPDEPVEHAPRRGMQLGLTLPLQGDLLRFNPDVTGLRVALASQDFPLDTISPLVEVSPIVRIGGALTSQLSWTARAPRALSGNLHVEHGLVDLERIGIPARDIQFDLIAEGRRMRIPTLSFRLGTGSARATEGLIDTRLTGNEIAAVQIHLRTDGLPASQEGNLYAYLDAEAQYTGTFRTDGHRGTVEIQTAALRVPNQSSRDLQELDPHSDIFIVGETHVSVGPQGRPYPIDIDFNTQSPVWVRRDDVEVAVRANGHIHFDPAGLALSGSVEQARRESWVDLFGKRFYFDRIGMEFDGSLVLNPLLDIAAHFDSPTAGRIGLTVSGRYLDPVITFNAEQFPSASQSEILALLVLGRRESRSAPEQATIAEQAQQAAASMLTGLVAGFGTTYTRRQLDAMRLPFVPRLIVEPGAAGQFGRYGLGATIQGVPRLYIEGTYGTVTSYGSAVTDPSAQRPQDFHGLAEYTVSEHWSISGNFGTSGRVGADAFYNFSP